MYLTAGCEINFAGLPANFGIRSLAQFDADLKRPYQMALNLGVTREVLTGLSVSLDYYRLDFKNITMRTNSLRTASSYDRIDVVSPTDGSVIPTYIVKPAFSRAVANVDSTSET